MIVRYEPWGAWVKLETEAAIIALDREGVRAREYGGKGEQSNTRGWLQGASGAGGTGRRGSAGHRGP